MSGRPARRALRPVAAALAAVVLATGCDPAPSTSPPASEAAATAVPGSAPQGSLPPEAAASGDPGPAAPAAPSSADLIEAAVAAGTIDEATGLLYRIYATFGDPRLPAEYATGRAVEDVVALMRAPVEIDSLPADIAAQIRPYIVRPTDPASAFHAPSRSASAGTVQTVAYRPPSGGTVTSAATCDQNLSWAYLDGTNYIRVWAPCGSADEAALPQVLAIADQMYAAESAYLGGQLPVEDSGGPNQGGDTRIDIYITGNCVPRGAGDGVVGPSSDPQCLDGSDGFAPGSSEYRDRGGVGITSGFVMINRRYLGNAAKLRGTIAHELFHVFQYAYNARGFYNASGAKWFLEATATWAEWRFANVVPSSNAGPVFLQFQGAKLSLQDDAIASGYVSFGWPLFMEQNGAGKVRAAWEAVVGKADADAIMDAIDGVLAFKDNFRVFGMRGWNRDTIVIASPVTPWLDAPPVSAGGSRIAPFGAKSPASIELKGTDKGATPRSLPGDSPSLWAHYQHFTVADDVGQVVLDFSGVKPADRSDVDALVKVKGKSEWERRDLPDGKTTWCVDNPKDDVEEFVVVLSNHAHRLAETLTGRWTVDSPKEPCLSYHIHIEWTDVFDGIPDPMTFDGYADKLNPDALGGQVMLIGSGTYSGGREGYIKCNPGLEGVMPTTGGGTATFQAIIVGDLVTVNAFADIDSTFPGITTWPFEGPREGTYDRSIGAETPILVSGQDPGTLCPHAYSGEATWEIKIKPPPS